MRRAEEEVEGGTKETILELKTGRGRRDDPGGGGEAGGKGSGKLALKEDTQEKFLVRLRFKLQSRGRSRSEALKERGKGR